jgi:glyoxylase I family protein
MLTSFLKRRSQSMAIHPPFTLQQIDHVVLRVRDVAAMQAFYCDALGCTVERRQDEIGLVQLRAGASLIDLVGVDGKLGRMGGAAPGAEGHNMDHLCLRVDRFDVDVIRAHLAALGARIGDFGSRYGAEGQGPSLYLHDPEGNMIELKGPPDTPAAGRPR